MGKLLKFLLYVVTALVQLAVVAEVVLLFVDLSAYKSHLERAASDALGMDVRIDGGLRAGVLSGPHVALRDVSVRNRGADLAAVSHVRLGVDLRPLIDRRVVLGTIELRQARLFVERAGDGTLNFERPGEKHAPPRAFDVAGFSIVRSTLHYTDRQSGARVEAEGCDVHASRLRFAGGRSALLWKRLSVETDVACRKIRINSVALSDVKTSLSARRGVFELKPVALRLFGGRGTGDVHADFTGPVARYQVRYALARLRGEELFKDLGDKVPRGTFDLSADLAFHGKTLAAVKRSAVGEVRLRGADLVLAGIDLDRAIARFESSQRFRFVDVGALLYAGPLGLLLSRGVSAAGAIPESGGTTHIGKLVSDWKIRNGVAHAADVALRTTENRIGLKGRVDLVNERFDDVVVAVIDARGCAKFLHTVRGPFRNPELDKPGALAALAGPMLKLFKSGECDVFYAGTVAPPT